MAQLGAERREAKCAHIVRSALPSVLVSSLVLATSAATAASSPPQAALRIRPGLYLSASVALSLRPEGTFLLQELGGTRHAMGRYAAAPNMLIFMSGQGDVGRTRFPLKCRVAEAFGGFRVVQAQPGCKPFDGLSFRTAN